MENKTNCQCFYCETRPDLVEAYYQGCIEAITPIYNWMQEKKIGLAPVHEDSLEAQHSILADTLSYYNLSKDLAHDKLKDNKIFASKRLIEENRQFLALYKSFNEYQVFYIRTNPETSRKEVVSCGDGSINSIDILDKFKHIIYIDTILNSLCVQVKQK